MKYKLIIWHTSEDKESAESMCNTLKQNNVQDFTVEWIRSRFPENDQAFNKKVLYIDVLIQNNVKAEDVCRKLMDMWPNAITYINLESQYPTSWEKRFEQSKNIKNSGKYVGIKMDKSFCRALPFSENTILIANKNYHFDGGILVEEKFTEENYHEMENNLVELGFDQISFHNIQKHCYKIDFTTSIIRGTTLIANGWFCDEFRIWRYPKYHAKIIFPNITMSNITQRGSGWYHDEVEWRIVETKQNTFFDCSGDDLSLNPAFW